MSLKYELCRDYIDGLLGYTRHGDNHRRDGPAMLWDDGEMYWFQYGDYHREDGPAKSTLYYGCRYFIRGKTFSQIEYLSINHGKLQCQ